MDLDAAGVKSGSINHHLATYATFAPGRINHHQLTGLSGAWLKGQVRGTLIERGWGAALGYPAIVPGDDSDEIAVHLFASPDLPVHWARLDAFEGDGYRRVAVTVLTAQGPVEAWIYAETSAPG